MVYAPFVSPSLLIKREILAYAVHEAVSYGITVKEVVETFFAGKPRPALVQQLDRMEAAAGVPPAETMALVNQFFEPEDIEPGDLEILIHGYASQMPTVAQAKEIVEAAQRLAKRARWHATRVRAAQAAYDAEITQNPEPPEVRWSAMARPIRARSVQRYKGLNG